MPVFEWKKEDNVGDKVLACFKVLSHTKKGNGKWLLLETTEVMWSNCNTHLVTFHSPLDVKALLQQLQRLRMNDFKRKRH